MTSTERRYPSLTDEGIAALRSRIGIPAKRDDRGKYTQINADAARNFSIGTGDANLLYLDEEHAIASRWGAAIAPPCILLGSGMPEGRELTDAEREVGRGGGLPGVHGMFAGRDFEWYQPLLDGDRLYKVMYEAAVHEKQGKFAGRQLLQMQETLFRNQRNEVVAKMIGWRVRAQRDEARQRETYFRDRHVCTPEEEERIDEAYEQEIPRGPEPRYWEDVNVGDEMGTMVRGPFRVTDGVAWEIGWGGPYARSGKYDHMFRKRHPGAYTRDHLGNWDVVERVHWDGPFAREIGVPAAYDYGAQRVAWMGNFLTNWMGDDAWLRRMWVQVRRFNIEGDILWHEGRVTAKRVVDGEHQVVCDVWAKNQLGEFATPGQAIVVLPSREHGPVQLPLSGQPTYPTWGSDSVLTPIGVSPLDVEPVHHDFRMVGLD